MTSSTTSGTGLAGDASRRRSAAESTGRSYTPHRLNDDEWLREPEGILNEFGSRRALC